MSWRPIDFTVMSNWTHTTPQPVSAVLMMFTPHLMSFVLICVVFWADAQIPMAPPTCKDYPKDECLQSLDVDGSFCGWCDHTPDASGNTSGDAVGICGFEDPCDNARVIFTGISGEGFSAPCWANFSHFQDVNQEAREKECGVKESTLRGWRVFGIVTIVFVCCILVVGLGCYLHDKRFSRTPMELQTQFSRH